MTSNLTRLLTSTLKVAKQACEYSWQSSFQDGRDVLSVDILTQWLDTANTKRPSLETSETTLTPRMDRQPASRYDASSAGNGVSKHYRHSVYLRGWCSGHTCTAVAPSTSYTYEQRLLSRTAPIDLLGTYHPEGANSLGLFLA